MSADPKSAKAIFLEAVEWHAPDQWPAFLDQACAGRPDLRGRVEALLAAHREVGTAQDRELPEGADPGPVVTVDVPPLRERPGDVIGFYKLLEPIGEGGFGVVFLAEQTQPVRRRVALKVLKAGMDTRQVDARFEAERQALAIMDHPHIAKVFDGGATPSGRPYFVMELVKGVPITDFCDQNHLTPRQRLELFLAVCQAVQHAHQKGIIHRDLKPSNVLVSRHDTTPVVKVIDFGVSKALGQELTDKTLFTGIAQMIGTPLYMSPEQAGMSDLDVDTRSDVYSLGVLLYELLTGTTPFTKERFQRAAYDEIRRIIREEEPPKPSTRLSESKDGLPSISALRHTEPARLTKLVRGDLDWIVMMCLEKDRNRRYETANGLARDIERYLTDDPVTAGPPSATYRFRKFARRNRAGLATAAAVAALLLVVAVLAVLYADRQRRFGLAQAEATRKQAEATRQITALAGDLEISLAESKRHLAGSNRLLAIRNFDRGQAAFEKGEVAAGMLWMIESWRSAVDAGDPALQHVARANLAHWRPHYPRLRAVLSHTRPIMGAPFSPDSRTVIVGSTDGTAQLWDVASGKEFGPSLQVGGQYSSFWFSRDGKTVLSSSFDAHEVRLWDATTGARLDLPVRLPPQVRILAGSIQPEGKIVLLGTEDNLNHIARLWDAAMGKPIGSALTHDQPINSGEFSPDSRIIQIHNPDDTARFWVVATGEPIALPLKRPGCAAFSPDGRTILTGSLDGTAQRWDAVTRQLVSPPMRQESQVRSLAFSPDGKTILIGGLGKEARLWDAATGQLIGVLAHQGQISATAFSPDGKTILTGSLDGTVRLFDVKAGQPLGQILEIPSTDYVAALRADGKVLISYPREPNYQRYVQLWDATTRRPIARIPQSGGNAEGCFSSDAKTFLTTEGDQTARLWDATTGVALGPAWPLPSHVYGPILSPDGKTVLLQVNDEQTFWICDAVTGSVRGPALRVGGHGDGWGFSPDGKTILFGRWDGEAQLWDAATLTPRGDPLRHPSCVCYGSFSPDGKSLLIGCEDGGIWLWDLATRKLLLPPLRLEGRIEGAIMHRIQGEFSSDGKTIVIRAEDRTVRLRDFATGQPIGPTLGHFDSVAFLADGTTLYAQGNERRLFPIPPDLPDELDRVATWVEVMTGLRLDAQQGLIQVLDHAAWLERRERLMQLGGPPETGPEQRLDPILFGPDPTSRARSFMARKQWDAAEAAFDEARRARPFSMSIILERGDLYALRGLWSEAAAYYATTVQQYPDVAPLHERLAATRLLAGDLPGYRAAGAALLERFQPIDDSTAAIRVAYACSLAPEAVTDLPGLIEVSERSTRWAEAVTNSPGRYGDREWCTQWLASNQRALGAVLFRAGRLEEALKRFEQAHKGFQPQAWDFLFLAMIHSGLGQDDEARRLLDQADQWIAEADKAAVGTENDVPRWSSMFAKPVVLLLRREAESLINANSSFPADPFAH